MLDPGATRFETDETLHHWYVRMVNEYCGQDPRLNALEDNISVFMVLNRKGNRLTGANFCTLVTSCDLEEYFLEPPPDCEAVYLRLDFDYGTLGQPFSHPVPHMHILGDLPPRFSFEVGQSGNVVMDYFDFLYRHFSPRKWKAWAEAVWEKDYKEAQRPPQDNPFETIISAFEESQIEVLRKHSGEVQRLKRILGKRKDELFAARMDTQDKELIRYPV